MIKGLFQSARSLQSGNQHVGVVANNLANINTSGFKREEPFSEILSNEGEIIVRQVTDYKQGELAFTGNPLDMAVKGEGFFAIQTENGKMLTRDGRFTISKDGYLVNLNGDKVLGTDGEISFGENIFQQKQNITVSNHGEIKVGETTVDDFLIVGIEDTKQLKKSGSNYFVYSSEDFAEQEEGKFELSQGYLESANVNPVEEMQAMIRLNKDYQSSFKIVNYLDESLEKANQIGKV
jgi:flagellar basal-body rod protein FlgG